MMNIIYARMPGYEYISVPSDAVARELKNLGHNITIVGQVYDVPAGNYDFVWSPYESVTLLGEAISRRLKIPHVAHIEWFPPWRILKDCNPEEYGFQKNDEELKHFEEHSLYYKKVGEAWLKANIKTIGNNVYKDYIAKFLLGDNHSGQELNAEVRFPSIDHKRLLKFKQTFSGVKKIPNQIISIARAVPNKRYDLLVKVINRLTVPVTWVIIGNGPELEMIKTKMTNQLVSVQYKGLLHGDAKNLEILKSSLFLGSWVGMPPIEAILLDCLPFIVVPPVNKENTQIAINDNFEVDKNYKGEYKNIFELYKYEDIFDNLPKQISKYIENFDNKKTSELCHQFSLTFLNNALGVKTAEKNAQNIIESFLCI